MILKWHFLNFDSFLSTSIAYKVSDIGMLKNGDELLS